MTTDVLIIGQGVAGTLMADECIRRGWRVLVVDDGGPGASSRIAAGNVNPVSGMRFTRTAGFAEAAPIARRVYERLEQRLGLRLIDRRPVMRVFRGATEVEVWEARAGRPESAGLECERMERLPAHVPVRAPWGGLLIRQAFQVRLADLLAAYRERLRAAGRFIARSVRPSELHVSAGGVRWDDVHAGRVIFCQGYRMLDNPWRAGMELRPAQGERLEVHAPGLSTEYVLHGGVQVVPVGGDRFWVGATVDWEDADAGPSAAGRRRLERDLAGLLTVPFEVRGHAAGIRPATRRRRPVFGLHPDTDRVAFLNGLGFKGALWAPDCAQRLAAVLAQGRFFGGDGGE